jgi:hypothetical protein
VSAKQPEREPRNEKLKIELPFEDAIRAALETKPPTKSRQRKKKPSRPRDP